MNLHRTKLDAFIRKTNGKIFSCIYLKKDGSVRAMTCRLGVTKHLKGTGKPKHNPTNSYVTVWDIAKRSYRIINLNTMFSIKTGGEDYYVQD